MKCNRKSTGITHNDFTFNYHTTTTSNITLTCKKENAIFGIFYRSLEFEHKRLVKINFRNNGENVHELLFVKQFAESNDAILYVQNSDFGKIEYPFSKEDAFHFNLSTLPLTLSFNMYNKIMEVLNNSMYNLFFDIEIK